MSTTTTDRANDAGPLARNPLFAHMDQHGELLSDTEQTELARQARDGCRASRNTLVERNMRLVVDLARRSGCRDEHDLLDRIQSGSIGLLRAAQKFDPDRGFAFSTYATWWVRQAVSRERDAGHPMGVSLKLTTDLRAASLALTREHGREPTLQELSSELNIDREQVAAASAAMQPHSLDVSVGADRGSTLRDLLHDPDALDPASIVEQIELCEQVDAHLAPLGDLQRRLIELRFGFETGGPETLERIAGLLGLTLNQTRQLEAHTMRQLQDAAALELARDDVAASKHSATQREVEASIPASLTHAFRAAMFGDPPTQRGVGALVPA